MELGDEHLRVQRASIGVQQVGGVEMGVNAMSLLAGTTSTDLQESRVLQLLNMVTAEELMDTDEYEGKPINRCRFMPPKLHVSPLMIVTEIVEDVREECEKYGKVLELKIPRPSGGRSVPGVGKVFVKFEEQESAQKALRALAGRKFADRTVVVTYFGEVRSPLTFFWDFY